ncbi:MAG: histidinol-phosphate transaminase [Methanoregula sp.]|uniref:histidinol-phosphate transaminase n=1 Tax=Methanoregula sp. TaxID=2052170 RepID=UPI0025FB362F|nr:histidinol-phosphate transaminase [Methanoregula sp.]MCK9630236.1 histidinol-phosphate transaminase [Methanoregula sp.]
MAPTQPPLDTLVPPYIRKIEAYVPSKPDDVLRSMYHTSSLVRMNNNENVIGPPQKSIEAIMNFTPERAAIYPNGDSYHLRHRLSEVFRHPACSFLIGNGANEVITFVIKTFCQKGDNIITTDKTFAVYEWAAGFSGVEARLVPLKDHAFDEEAMIGAIDGRTKVIFICNPNNPTGTYWSEARLRSFLRRVDGRQIVVVDEAYAEFVDQPDYPEGMNLISEFPNLVVFRTFSKMYGLAALRIGYLAGNRNLVDIIRRTCIVYSVNTLAQEAALGALADDGSHIRRTRELVRASKEFLISELDRMNLPWIAGEGNFVVIRLPVSDTLVYRRLMAKGYMVRTMTGFRFPNHIRVTLHDLPVMEGFVQALRSSIA